MQSFNEFGFEEFSSGSGLENEAENINTQSSELALGHYAFETLLKGEGYNVIVGEGVVEKMRLLGKEGHFAVFKPSDKQSDYEKISGEVWILGESIPKREVAAYVVSNELGFDFVPETVYRTDIENGGSLQEWVAGQNCESVDLQSFQKEDLVKVAVFYHIIGAIDGHKRNFIKTPEGKIRLIDNGLSFPEEEVGFYSNYEITNFVRESMVPEGLLELIREYVDERGLMTKKGNELLAKLVRYVSKSEARMVFARMRSILVTKKTPDPFLSAQKKKELPF